MRGFCLGPDATTVVRPAASYDGEAIAALVNRVATRHVGAYAAGLTLCSPTAKPLWYAPEDDVTPMQAPAPTADGADQTASERSLAVLIVTSLQLEMAAADIQPDARLFGEGLGLDSIDALELALAISRTYGFELRSDNEENQRIFGSLRALSDHVDAHRTR